MQILATPLFPLPRTTAPIARTDPSNHRGSRCPRSRLRASSILCPQNRDHNRLLSVTITPPAICSPSQDAALHRCNRNAPTQRFGSPTTRR
ncbi:hypothetical protein VTI74DRAFT_4748 [Chaetomium olivicolor]